MLIPQYYGVLLVHITLTVITIYDNGGCSGEDGDDDHDVDTISYHYRCIIFTIVGTTLI